MKGIKMNPEDPDGYIAKFEEMVRHVGYNINDPLTIGVTFHPWTGSDYIFTGYDYGPNPHH